MKHLMPHSLSEFPPAKQNHSVQHPKAKRNQILQCCAERIHRAPCLPQADVLTKALQATPPESAWPQAEGNIPCAEQGWRGSGWSPGPLSAGAKELTNIHHLTIVQLCATSLQHKLRWTIDRIQDRIAFKLLLSFSISSASRFPFLLQVWTQQTPTTKSYSLLQLCFIPACPAAWASPELILGQLSFCNCSYNLPAYETMVFLLCYSTYPKHLWNRELIKLWKLC